MHILIQCSIAKQCRREMGRGGGCVEGWGKERGESRRGRNVEPEQSPFMDTLDTFSSNSSN